MTLKKNAGYGSRTSAPSLSIIGDWLLESTEYVLHVSELRNILHALNHSTSNMAAAMDVDDEVPGSSLEKGSKKRFEVKKVRSLS